MKPLKIAVCLIVLYPMLAQAQAPIPKPAVPTTRPPTDSALLRQTGQQLKQIGRSRMDSLLQMAKTPLQPLTGELKLLEGKPVSFNQLDAEASYNYFRDTAGLGLGVFNQSQGFIGYNINYAMSLMSMPFNLGIRESNGVNTLNYTPFNNFTKFNFDHEAYMETIRQKVLQKVNPQAVMNSALSRVDAIRHTYEQSLQSEIAQVQGEYAKEYRSTITLPDGASNLSANDMGSLQHQLLPGTALEKYRTDLAHLQQMAREKDPASLAKDSSYHQLQGEVKKYEALENIYGKITGYKKKFENNAFVKELRSHLPFNPDNFKAYISNPANLEKVLDDQGGLSSIQRLFVNIKTLDLGQNAVQQGELNVRNTMNTGVNTQFQNRSLSMGVLAGKNNAVNYWQQAGLTSQVTNEFSNLSSFSIGSGSGSPIDQSISFSFFNMNNAPGLAGTPTTAYLPLAPHKDGVISVHTGLQLTPDHALSLDISKSFGSFKQNVTGDSSFNKSIADGSVFNNAGMSNFAAVLSYTGEILKTDIKLYGKTVGLGYNNPGNPMLRSGEKQLGLGLARKFLRSKLTVKYDGDYRHQIFDPNDNYTYSSFTNKFQVGYKISRNDKVNLTYQRSDYKSEFYGQVPSAGINSRLQADGSYRFMLNGKKVISNVTVSHQLISLPMLTGGGYKSNNLLVSHTSTLMLGQNLLSLTLLENYSDNKSYYFNTSMFSTEANYSFAISAAGNTRLTSCLGYYDNAGWNRQLGIRQQISAMIKEKLSLDFQIGCRKAVQTTRTELANQLFLNSTMHYTFK